MSNHSSEHAQSHLVEVFDHNYDTAQQISDQNDRYDQLAADDVFTDYEDIRRAAIGGVANEQTATLTELRGLDTQAYSDIAAQYNNLEAELTSTYDELEQTQVNELLKQKLLTAVERAIELSPSASNAVRDLESAHLAEMDDERRQKLKLAAEALRQNLEEMGPIFEAAARPWPIPRVPQEDLELIEAEEVEQVEENDVLIIEDILPTETQHHTMNEATRRFVERYGHTVNASVMASVYLIEHAGKVLTPLDIGREVYANSEEFEGMSQKKADKVMHARILTLLNENENRVKAMLDKEGYTLIYGHRIVRTGTGKQLGPARRIYRTVKTDQDPYAPTSFIEEVTQAGDLIGINEAVSPNEAEGLEVEYEPIVGLAEIDEIEKTVQIASKHDKWNARTNQLLTEVEALIPWLEEQGLMPRSAGGVIHAAKVKAVITNKRNLATAPFALSKGSELMAYGRQLDFTILATGLLGRDVYKGAPSRYVTQAHKRIQELEERYFEMNEPVKS